MFLRRYFTDGDRQREIAAVAAPVCPLRLLQACSSVVPHLEKLLVVSLAL